MITFLALVLLLSAAGLAVTSFPLPSFPENLLAFCNYVLAQIVILSIVLSETFGFSANAFVLGHLGLTGIAIAVWTLRGQPGLSGLASYFQRFRAPGGESLWLIVGLAFVVIVLLGLNAEFYRLAPSMNKDALSYHLPRAYFWLQQGSLHYLPTIDFRWTEFPPNSSIVLMWMMAVGIGFEWMHLPQVLGAIMIGVGVFRLTVLCAGDRLGATLAALICLSFPAAIYQMGTSGNDLLVGGMIVSCICFVAQAFRPGSGQPEVRRSAVQAGISLGLGVGTKITFLLFLPGLALFSLGTLALLGWKQWRARAGLLVVTCAVGFAFLGAYSYVQNLRMIGTPVMSQETNSILSSIPAELYSPLRNAVLSLYQALSWHGLQSNENQALPTLQRQVIWMVNGGLRLGLETMDSFKSDGCQTQLFTDENRAGYGVLGFLILLASPFVGAAALFQFLRGREFTAYLRCGLVVIGLSFFVVFNWKMFWAPTSARYLIEYLPILVPSAVCLVARPAWLRNTVYVLATGYGLWLLLYCIVLEPSRQSLVAAARAGKTPFHQHLAGSWLPQLEVLKTSVPPGAAIGYAGRLDSWAFVLPRELPDHKFLLLWPHEIVSALSSGRVAAVVTELFPTDFTRVLPLPGTLLRPKQALHVADPESALRKNLKAYGLTLDQEQQSLSLDSKAIASFTNIHDLWPMPLRYGPLAGLDPDHDDHLQFWIPAGMLPGGDSALEVDIPLDSAFPEGLISHITCNSQNVPFSITNHRLNFSIPANVRQSDALLQDCRVYFSGDVLAVVKSEEDFPQINPLYFGSPWTVRVTGE
jgi:hypothetical protein